MKNTTKPYTRKPQNVRPKKEYIKAQLAFSEEITEEVYNQIVEELAHPHYNKLSYPLSAPKYLFDSNCDDETKLVTVGYIKSFDKETTTFTVDIFPARYEVIANFEVAYIEPLFRTYGNKAGVITKLNIVPGYVEENESDGTGEPMEEIEAMDNEYNELSAAVDVDESENEECYDVLQGATEEYEI